VGKSAQAFRTISEVSSELDVPQHVLRFWESKFTQVRPLKRGGGRRYYRPDDIDLLRAIKNLLYEEGYTIKGVQKLLRETGPRQIVEGLKADGARIMRPQADGHNGPARKTAPAADGGLEDVIAELEEIRDALTEE